MSFSWFKKLFKPKVVEPYLEFEQHTVLNSKVVGEEPASNYDSTIDEVAQSLEGDAYVEHVKKMDQAECIKQVEKLCGDKADAKKFVEKYNFSSEQDAAAEHQLAPCYHG